MSAVPGFLRARAVVRLAGIAIGVVFITAALGKIGDLGAFAAQVHNYRLAPVWSENLIAMTLPWVELLAGLGLVLGVRPRAGAVVLLALIAVFTVAVGSAWARGLDFECGCFGKASAATVGARKVAENLGYTLLAAIAVLRPKP